VGTGLVGLELIRQIVGEQGSRIKQRYQIDLKIVGLADSSGFIEIHNDSQLDEIFAFKNQRKSFSLHGDFKGDVGNLLNCMVDLWALKMF
jgi:homoserine dehydrogenase